MKIIKLKISKEKFLNENFYPIVLVSVNNYPNLNSILEYLFKGRKKESLTHIQ
jgi:cobalamin biosynthesis Co2+ chelatase CbiK